MIPTEHVHSRQRLQVLAFRAEAGIDLLAAHGLLQLVRDAGLQLGGFLAPDQGAGEHNVWVFVHVVIAIKTPGVAAEESRALEEETVMESGTGLWVKDRATRAIRCRRAAASASALA